MINERLTPGLKSLDRVDTKNRIVGCDRFEGRGRGVVRNRQVMAATCGDLGPCLEDRGALVRRNLRELNRLRPTALDRSLSSGCTYVLHPFGTLPKHRHEVTSALICGGNQNG